MYFSLSSNLWAWLMVVLVTLFHPGTTHAGYLCEVCGKEFRIEVFLCKDQITLVKREICASCIHNLPNCFLCSIPVWTNAPGYREFADGRILCKRDAATSVAGAADGERIVNEVRDWMNREFSRFMGFSDTNTTVKLVDRPTLEALFKFPGRDATCPNIWGTTQPLTNNGVVTYEVGLLEGLPMCMLRHTVAHELAHVWLHENVPLERYQRLDRDANEGFCELIAWLVDETCTEANLKAHMRRNLYTRGQIEIFLGVHQRFGMNNIVEWLKYGVDKRLVPDQVDQINNVVMPPTRNSVAGSATNEAFTFPLSPPPPLYSAIALQGITWNGKRSTAMINGNTFGVNEEGRVKLGGSNVTIKCLSIEPNAVRIRIGAQEQVLTLPSR